MSNLLFTYKVNPFYRHQHRAPRLQYITPHTQQEKHKWSLFHECLIIIIIIGYYIILYVQVSCASSSTELTDRTRFLYHFGVLATEANLAFGFYSIIRHYDWRRVVILLQEENLFIAVCCIIIDHNFYHPAPPPHSRTSIHNIIQYRQ